MLQFLFYIFIGLISFIFLFGYIYRKYSGICTSPNKLKGKTVIVTGASAGIGKEAALDFARRGARVILACRNLEKAGKVKEWIVSSTGNKNVVCRHLELSDLDSVRKFAKETIQKESKIDVLVNNAGISVDRKLLSKQGYELTLATNHYGPFLLTNLLLDHLIKSAPSRIINVSSICHKLPCLDLGDLHYYKRTYRQLGSYSQSKLCNVLFTNELARRLQQSGVKNVKVNSLHPGSVKTEIINKEGKLITTIIDFIFKHAMKTASLGAQTTIYLAVSDEGGRVTGKYFVDCEVASTSSKAKDENLAKELWRISEKEVGLTNKENYFKKNK